MSYPTITKQNVKIALIFSTLYLAWTYFVVGFRMDHLYFLVFLTAMFFGSRLTQKFTFGFVFFIAFWIIYDSMRAFPNYLFNPIATESLYLAEKSWFGIGPEQLTPNEYLAMYPHVAFDLISGIFYLTWVPVPLALALYFFKTDKEKLIRFTAAFLFTNLLGFCVYYSFPAAPPWYYAEYGSIIDHSVQANAAQLLRFDELIGYPLFEDMYTKNSNIFAAVPSLHSAYPVVALYYATESRKLWIPILILIDVIGIWYAAVYSYHHYIIDVGLGLLCALVGIFIFEKLILSTKIRKSLNIFAEFIDK